MKTLNEIVEEIKLDRTDINEIFWCRLHKLANTVYSVPCYAVIEDVPMEGSMTIETEFHGCEEDEYDAWVGDWEVTLNSSQRYFNEYRTTLKAKYGSCLEGSNTEEKSEYERRLDIWFSVQPGNTPADEGNAAARKDFEIAINNRECQK